MSTKGGADVIQLALRIVGYPDRPGIARIYSGDMLLFDGDNAPPVLDIGIRLMVPFHTHFETANFALAWKEIGK